ncbi:hypothetical protein [Vibrio sagamiensis]|nr:hypothetical protein [Vibrio sagamiensis]
MKTSLKSILSAILLMSIFGCSQSFKDENVYIVHEIKNEGNINYTLPFSKAINSEIKNGTVSWIHGINIYHTNNISKERLYQLKIDLENIYDFSPKFTSIDNYQDRQLLLWEVHVSDQRLIQCEAWEVPNGHHLMNEIEIDQFLNGTACSSLEVWSK